MIRKYLVGYMLGLGWMSAEIGAWLLTFALVGWPTRISHSSLIGYIAVTALVSYGAGHTTSD